MMTDETRTAIESLSAFAFAHGELAFVHLCTAALAGEESAITRVTEALAEIAAANIGSCGNALIDTLGDASCSLAVIRSTDTTYPNGAVARGVIEI